MDTTALSPLFVPGCVVFGYKTKTPVKFARERLDYLVERVTKAGDSILIPTPVLSEVLVKLSPDRINDVLAELNGSAWFRVESFDAMAAVELGTRTAKAISSGDKKEGSRADYTKVKFDRQIVSISIVGGASELISDDPHMASIGERWGFKVVSLEDLPLPPHLIPPPLFADLEDDDFGKEKAAQSSSTQL